MKRNTSIILIFAGAVFLGGCARKDLRYDRYENGTRYAGVQANEGYYGVDLRVGDSVRIESGRAYRN